MSKKTKFYDIVPKEKRSIRNISIPEKGNDDSEEDRIIESDELSKGKIKKSGSHKNSVKNSTAEY